MDIKSIEIEKNKLFNIHEEYYKKLIDIIQNNESVIESYKAELMRITDENIKLKAESQLLQDKIITKDNRINDLKNEIINLKNEVHNINIKKSNTEVIFCDLKEAYINNREADVEDFLYEIVDDIERIESNIKDEDKTLFMYLCHIYNQLSGVLERSEVARRYFQLETKESELLRMLVDESTCKVHTKADKCVKTILINEDGLFLELEKDVKERIVEDIFDLSYRVFDYVENEERIVNGDKTIKMKAWAKKKDEKSWILVNGLYSSKYKELYLDGFKISNLKLNEKVVSNSKELTGLIEELKKRFLAGYTEYFKIYVTSKKVYRGNDKLIEEILDSNISGAMISKSLGRTLLLMSVFFGFHDELIKSSLFIRNIFREDSVTGELLRIIDIEKGITPGTSIRIPTKTFIENHINDIDIDYDVKNKAFGLIDNCFYNEFTNVIITEFDKLRCCNDNKILSLDKGYLKYVDKYNEYKYTLFEGSCCEACGALYVSKIKGKNIRERYNSYKLVNNQVFEAESYKVNNEVEKNTDIKIYETLLEAFNDADVKRSLELFNNIISNDEVIKKLDKVQYVTLLFIGYIVQNNTMGAEKIKSIANLNTSVDTILYNKMINGKDVNDYLRLYGNSLKLIDPVVKDRVLNEVLIIGDSYQEENLNDKKFENNLSAESVIKKLGYSTSLGREERWNILKNNIVPKVGKSKVISHLSFLIRMNKGRNSMNNAVYEWKYDLERLLNL